MKKFCVSLMMVLGLFCAIGFTGCNDVDPEGEPAFTQQFIDKVTSQIQSDILSECGDFVEDIDSTIDETSGILTITVYASPFPGEDISYSIENAMCTIQKQNSNINYKLDVADDKVVVTITKVEQQEEAA